MSKIFFSNFYILFIAGQILVRPGHQTAAVVHRQGGTDETAEYPRDGWYLIIIIRHQSVMENLTKNTNDSKKYSWTDADTNLLTASNADWLKLK